MHFCCNNHDSVRNINYNNQSPSDNSPSSLLSRVGRFRSRPSPASRLLRFPPPFFPRLRRFFTHRPSASSDAPPPPPSTSPSPPLPSFVCSGASTAVCVVVSRSSSPARSAPEAEAAAAWRVSRSNLAFELAMARSAFPRNRTFGRIFVGDLDADADAEASLRTAFAMAWSLLRVGTGFVSRRAVDASASPPAHAASFGAFAARLFGVSSRASADAMRSCARANPSRGGMV